jgi:hypothetical protein
MYRTKIISIFLILILICPLFSITKAISTNQKDENIIFGNSIFDFIQGVKIDFTPPDLIQDCGSYFILNVTLTRERPHIFHSFSLSVFLKVEGGFGNNIFLIGSKNFVYFPPFTNKITVQIPCITKNNIITNIQKINTIEKNKCKINEASIGVKISKIGKWCFEGFIWRLITRNYITIKKYFQNEYPSCKYPTLCDFILYGSYNLFNYNMFPQNFIKIIYRFNIFLNNIRYLSRFITWKTVNIVEPFIRSTNFEINKLEIDNETNEHGDFKLNLTVYSKENYEVKIVILIDISDKPFMSSIIPSVTKDTSYNVGHYIGYLEPDQSLDLSFDCSFPNQSFSEKDYEISIEIAPFIPIDNSSIFGPLFYDFRYKFFNLPNYYINGTVLKLVKELWYNTPIYYGDKNTATAFLTKYEKIKYKGETPVQEFVGDIMDEVRENSWFFIIAIFLFIISYGFVYGLINWLIRKKFNG